MQSKVLRLDHRDNVLIALSDLKKGEEVRIGAEHYVLASDVPAKHKFATGTLAPGAEVRMYGVLIGKAVLPIQSGEAVTTRNLRHDSAPYSERASSYHWTPPDVSRWKDRTFQGFLRANSRAGTRNYWIVLPLVFCENRNLAVLKQAFEEQLGFVSPQIHRQHVSELVDLYRQGRLGEIQRYQFSKPAPPPLQKVFPNLDGIKFLSHEAGCGGTHEDAKNLCGLLADYILHPNVAGATVLSLGCQHAQGSLLQEQLHARGWKQEKPLLIFEQQRSASESEMLLRATQETFLGLIEANKAIRQPLPLAKLCAGLKCGGSDGFSGISANPALGHTADILAALGGTGILAEFPELCGVEQELINRCRDPQIAERFMHLMKDYAARAKAVRASFEMNPSPGNIRDGLITDAMKSAGAAKKGGTAPVAAVLDYPERETVPGLNLLCTPGNDVECVTAQVGAGANLVLFTTGLGTPTGNPIAPVVKISTNSSLAERMSDIIDFDAGDIIAGESSIAETGERLLDFSIHVASGDLRTKAEEMKQDDFIPWKRGVSL